MEENIKFNKMAILLLIISGLVYSQTLYLGANGDIGIINTNSKTGIGLGLNGEYKLQTLPFSLRFTYRVYTATFSDAEKLSKHSYNMSVIDGDILYHPFTGSLDAYIGLGISYSLPKITQDGNVLEINNKIVRPKNAENTLNINLLLGFRFVPERFFSPYIELFYWPMQLKYDILLEDRYGNVSKLEGNTGLEKYLIRLGFCLRIYN
ncbi:MAG: hypothetical protein SCALA702_02360 [Melioribacteraceae bacterium]|nr:MAG: hypothetical protein SCALA702_02360 [Melioribacteraceae bacterium]